MSSAELPHIKGYVIQRKLAQGGMGVVYAAEDATLGRPVAIKMIRSELLNLEEGDTAEQREVAVARFLREARAAASIRSNHVAHVLQFGRTADGDLYLVLEFLDGLNLKQVVRKQGPLSVERVVAIGKQICRGMRAAHELGIVHRDLKPGNVMLVEQDGNADFVKILDFGVAKMVEDANAEVTQTGSMVGTHTCMAPEQIRGQKVDARTDIYATGVLLFRLLTGRAPFTGADPLVVLHQHLNDPAPKPSEFRSARDIPTALDMVITRCLEKDPAARIGTMAELERLLVASLEPSAELPLVDARAPTEVFGAVNTPDTTAVALQTPEAALSEAETRAMAVPSSGEFSVEVVDVPDAADPPTPGTNSGQVVFIAPPDTAPAAGGGARWAIVAAGLFGGVVIAVAAVSVLLYFAAANKAAAAKQAQAPQPQDPAPAEQVDPDTLEPKEDGTAATAQAESEAATDADAPADPDASEQPEKATKSKRDKKSRSNDKKTERRADKKADDNKRKKSRKASRDKAKAKAKAKASEQNKDKKRAADKPEKKADAPKAKKRQKPDFVRVHTGDKPE